MNAVILDAPVTKIRVVRNPRTTFNETELRELAESIREHGVIEPLIVEEAEQDWLDLVAGERRLRAAKMAGLISVPCVVRERSNHGGRERLILAVVENDQRVDMNAMDRADAYKSLRDEFKMSVRDIAKKMGKAEVVIRGFLVLTDLDQPIQGMIRKGFWKDPNLAKALLAIPDAETRIGLAKRLFENKVSLKASIRACARTLELLAVSKRKAGRPSDKKMRTPSLALAAQFVDVDADEAQEPPRWNMLKQVGKVPAWESVVASAAHTCNECALKEIASIATCRDCGAVTLLQSLMESAR